MLKKRFELKWHICGGDNRPLLAKRSRVFRFCFHFERLSRPGLPLGACPAVWVVERDQKGRFKKMAAKVSYSHSCWTFFCLTYAIVSWETAPQKGRLFSSNPGYISFCSRCMIMVNSRRTFASKLTVIAHWRERGDLNLPRPLLSKEFLFSTPELLRVWRPDYVLIPAAYLLSIHENYFHVKMWTFNV